jgi:hypothetical protein
MERLTTGWRRSIETVLREGASTRAFRANLDPEGASLLIVSALWAATVLLRISDRELRSLCWELERDSVVIKWNAPSRHGLKNRRRSRRQTRRLYPCDGQTQRSLVTPPITDRQWTEEVTRALAAAGLPWQAGSCWCEKNACAAEVIHRSTGKTRLVRLLHETFSTAMLRRNELVRLLQDERQTP